MKTLDWSVETLGRESVAWWLGGGGGAVGRGAIGRAYGTRSVL